MSESSAIKIKIPNACHQSWDEMSLSGQNRFCKHCQKTVVDFTLWSDTALHAFFSKNKGRVCGRFLATQVARPINIPHQPHSRLYRLAITLGLTLTFTLSPHLSAHARPPKISCHIAPQLSIEGGGEIHGKILNENKEPQNDVAVQAFQNGVLKGSGVTDIDGEYLIKSLEVGHYDLLLSFSGYDTVQVVDVIINDNRAAIVNRILKKTLENTSPAKIISRYRQHIQPPESPDEIPTVFIAGEVTIDSATQGKTDTNRKRKSGRKNKTH